MGGHCVPCSPQVHTHHQTVRPSTDAERAPSPTCHCCQGDGTPGTAALPNPGELPRGGCIYVGPDRAGSWQLKWQQDLGAEASLAPEDQGVPLWLQKRCPGWPQEGHGEATRRAGTGSSDNSIQQALGSHRGWCTAGSAVPGGGAGDRTEGAVGPEAQSPSRPHSCWEPRGRNQGLHFPHLRGKSGVCGGRQAWGFGEKPPVPHPAAAESGARGQDARHGPSSSWTGSPA